MRGGDINGIVANPFLEHAFKTLRYTIAVTIHDDGAGPTRSDGTDVRGKPEPFSHTDRNTLRKIGEPTPNPTAQAAMKRRGGRGGRPASKDAEPETRLEVRERRIGK